MCRPLPCVIYVIILQKFTRELDYVISKNLIINLLIIIYYFYHYYSISM